MRIGNISQQNIPPTSSFLVTDLSVQFVGMFIQKDEIGLIGINF